MTTERQRLMEGEVAPAISRALVNLHKKYAGRGPSYARTYIHDELVVTVLSDTMTPAEQTLKDVDREELVREQRRVFQDAFRKEAIALAEELTGQRVLAFLSDHAIDPDYAVELFVLAPRDDV